jgi:hypothetical protein
MRFLAIAIALVTTSVPPAAPRDGVDVIRAMHAAHAGSWFRTLTLTQRTAYPNARVEVWYKAMALPGQLRIDVAPLADRHTLIFQRDSVYQFQQGQPVGSAAMVHPLQLLGFDIYLQDPDVTIRKLRFLGFDLSQLREDSWQGRRYWIVGALVGDSLSREFWVEQERLLFSRLVQSAPRAGDVPGKRDLAEIHFTDFRQAGGGWLAGHVGYFNNGERVESEDYDSVTVNQPLPPDLFDAAVWRPSWTY